MHLQSLSATKIYCGIIILLLIGFSIGYVARANDNVSKLASSTPTQLNCSINNKNTISEIREGGGHFTNPLLDCIGGDNASIPTLNVSQFELNSLVDDIKKSGKADLISIYFRDLNNGPSIGINPNEQFIGASLLKLPVLIAYMKLAETDKSLLSEKIQYKYKTSDVDQYFNSSTQIEEGKTYTIEELIHYMIDYSDNNAAILLTQKIGLPPIEEVFKAVGFGLPPGNAPYPVDARTYTGLFRILFNASYLSKASSEKALKLLTDVEFNKGISAPLPASIAVAHKFGISGANDTHELHDCGIIYYPTHPYLLCVMTQGKDYNDLSNVISQISQFIYDQVRKN